MEYEARVVIIQQETPTVKSFLLDLQGDELSFFAGQYMDVFIEAGYDILHGGFSITSSPLHRSAVVLTVKKLLNRPASVFMHEGVSMGDLLLLMGPSGEFYYTPEMGNSLVLIAGGIGIMPFMSMVRHVDEARLDVNITVVYSARTPSELLFFRQLQDISARNPRISCHFTITRPSDEPWEGNVGRIAAPVLEPVCGDPDALFYVCGPTGMPESISATLGSLGIDPSRVRTESW